MKRVRSAPEKVSFDLAKFGVRYEDGCWELRHYVVGESYHRVCLDFLKFPSAWRSSAKDYFARTLLGLVPRASTIPLTLRERFYAIKSFAIWCKEHGAASPKEIDSELIEYWGRKVVGFQKGRRITPRAEACRSTNVEDFLRGHTGCSAEVRAACSAVAQRSRKRIRMAGNEARTDALGEDLILRVLRDALVVVQEDAPEVLRLVSKFAGPRATRSARRGCRHWHSEWVGDRPSFRSEAMKRLGERACLSEERMVGTVIGAAITVIALLSVMRTSELQRLCVGCVEKEGDDEFGSWVIKGILAKSGRAHTWIVVPEVKAAVEAIELLGAEGRANSGTKALLAARVVSRKPYLSGRARAPSKVAWASMLLCRVREFALLSCPEGGAALEHLSFRKTRRFLARFVARRDRSSLGALAFQYGHLDAQITDAYYVGSDPELTKLLNEESSLEVIRAMEDIARSNSVHTNIPAEVMEATRQRIEAVLSRASTQKEVFRMLGAGVVLGPCDWGYCFYRQGRSKCEGNEDGPNKANRTPTTCASCLNFAATPRHAEWWSRRVADLEEFARFRGAPAQSKRIAAERLAQAVKILSAIGGER
jgi:integrase